MPAMYEASDGQSKDYLNDDLTKILVGRDEETRRLDRIIENKQRGASLVVIRGDAGAGKSTFVRAYPWKERGWILASGNFAEHRMKEPYSAIIEALNNLFVQWIANDRQEEVSRLDELQLLLTNNLELLKDVLPACFFEAAGVQFQTQKPSNASPSDETYTAGAVNAAFRRVISFLCASKPVALFLEDLHWIDHASLDIVEALVSSGMVVDGLLLVVSHRTEEVKEGHIFKTCLDKIHEQPDAVVQTIDILDLDVDSVSQLLTRLLGIDPADPTCLAEMVYQKTGGNPFAVQQVLHRVRQENYLSFSYASHKWECGDVTKLDMITRFSDNVSDVVATMINKLPEETQLALKVASCLGKHIPIDVLEEFFSNFPEDIKWDYSVYECIDTIQALGLAKVFECAVMAGLLNPCDDGSAFMWSHDRQQDIAFSLIPKADQVSLHINLGKLLWKRSYYKDSGKEAMVFMAADQLSRVPTKESNSRLGIVATHIHFGAGKLSMTKSAPFPAMESLRLGAETIKHRADRWDVMYDLSLELLSCLAEVAVQIGLHEEAMEAVREIDRHARCLDDKFRSQLVMLKSLTSCSKRDYSLGVEKTLELLKSYGEKLPTKLLPGQFFLENQKLRLKLPGGRLDGLMDLPYMTDSRSLKVTTLLTRKLRYFAHFSKTQKQAASLSSIRALNLACKMGVCSDTVMAVAWMASDLKRECHHQEACEYGQLAVKLMKKFPQKPGSLHAIVLMIVHAEILPSVRPFHDSLEPMMECHNVGLKIGDTDPAMGALLGYTFSYLSIGYPLASLSPDLTSFMQKASQLGLPSPFQLLFKIFRQAVLNLTEGGENPTDLNGEIMNQDEELSRVAGGAVAMTKRDIYTFRLLLACVYSDWDTAETLLDFLESFLGFEGLISRDHFRMVYIGLAAFIVGRKSGKRKYLTLANKVAKAFRTQRKLGYVNGHPILAMLQAESSPSKEGYERAIKVCAGLGLVHYEAFLSERMGSYCMEQLDFGSADFYILRAYALYRDWGAIGKMDALKQQYACFLDQLSDFTPEHPGLTGIGEYSEQESILLAKLAWENLAEGGTCDGLSIDTSRESMSTTSSNSDGP